MNCANESKVTDALKRIPTQFGRDRFHPVPFVSTWAWREENKSDAVERVPTGTGVLARGRDDFHIVVRTSFTSSLIGIAGRDEERQQVGRGGTHPYHCGRLKIVCCARLRIGKLRLWEK